MLTAPQVEEGQSMTVRSLMMLGTDQRSVGPKTNLLIDVKSVGPSDLPASSAMLRSPLRAWLPAGGLRPKTDGSQQLLAVVNQVMDKNRSGALGEIRVYGQIADDLAALEKVVHKPGSP